MKKQHIINETFLDAILAKKLGTTYTPPKEINDPDFDEAAKHFIIYYLEPTALSLLKLQ